MGIQLFLLKLCFFYQAHFKSTSLIFNTVTNSVAVNQRVSIWQRYQENSTSWFCGKIGKKKAG